MSIESTTSYRLNTLPQGTLWSLVLLTIPLLTLSVVVISQIILQFTSINFIVGVASTVMGEILVITLMTLFIRWKYSISFKDFFNLRIPEIFSLSNAFLAGVGFLFIATFVQVLLNSLGVGLESSDTSNAITSGGMVLALFALVCAPVLEEFLFRGVVFGSLDAIFEGSSKLLTWVPYVLSSAMFSLMHAQGFSSSSDFAVLGVTFTFGMVLCGLFKKYKNLFIPIMAHMSYNGTILLLVFISS